MSVLWILAWPVTLVAHWSVMGWREWRKDSRFNAICEEIYRDWPNKKHLLYMSTKEAELEIERLNR